MCPYVRATPSLQGTQLYLLAKVIIFHQFSTFLCLLFEGQQAKRVKESVTRFIEGKLHLKVNRDKTIVSYVQGVKYLGYSFYVMKGKCQLTVHPIAKSRMKAKLKELTSRSNGWGYAKRKQELEEYIWGWVGYYHLANMKRFLMETDEWLRRRLRMCIWKSWKRVKTRIANLIKCGIDKYQAYLWGNSRLGYWRIAGSYILVIGTAVCGTARTVV